MSTERNKALKRVKNLHGSEIGNLRITQNKHGAVGCTRECRVEPRERKSLRWEILQHRLA